MTTTGVETSVSRLLFLHAQTPVHPGSGTALGVIDLPIQRERHTLWPTVPGSTLKGILRDACRRNGGGNGREEDLLAAFGPETQDADKHAGAMAVTDARIVAFPVRSLRGVFAWVTSPGVLERLRRDATLADCTVDLPAAIPEPRQDGCSCAPDSPLLVNGDRLVLEEFEMRRESESGMADEWAAWIAGHGFADELSRKRFLSHLAVVHDDHFTHFVRHATEVVARIGLDYQKKTVKKRALFYQEFLPAETLFHAMVFANSSRRQSHEKSATGVMEYVTGCVPSVLQIGGDETTGKGLCVVRFSSSC